MIFLTVNDSSSGVYKSQVVEVVKELNQIGSEPVRLVALISLRNFSANRKKIRSWSPDALVLPLLPGLRNWKRNSLQLRFIKGIKKERIIARNPMAFFLASNYSQQVIYDGRGALKSELEEYPDIIADKSIVKSIGDAERLAVKTAFMRIAVSQKLVEYWQREFDYADSRHVIIPCTITPRKFPIKNEIEELRINWGYQPRDILMAYAGGLAGWQSFELLKKSIVEFCKNPNVKIVFLSPPSDEIAKLENLFPGRVVRKWLDPDAVHSFLCAADYGLVIRNQNTTNLVSSPVKFAEYLNAGLKVIISKNIGDFSELVEQNNLGAVEPDADFKFERSNYEERLRIASFAENHLSKASYHEHYQRLFS